MADDATPPPTTNPRGIPYAPFVDSVSTLLSSRADVEPTLKSFQEMISKYQFMELNTQRRAAGLAAKIPDIARTLDMVRFLMRRADDAPDLPVTFELADTLYAKATVPRVEEVALWLGANVMLSYPTAEAAALLEAKLDGARAHAAHCVEDLEFLREQITTLEVATARVYNWDVVMRRKEGGKGEGEGEGGEEG